MKKFQFFIMRKITIKWLMDLIVALKANMLGKISIQLNKESLLINSSNIKLHSKNLKTRGFTVLDKRLTKSIVEEIVSYSEKVPCFDFYHNSTKPVSVKNAPPETHVAYYNRNDLIKFKPIIDLANDPAILTIVQEFLGAKPTISNINMWWSFGGRKQPEHAQLFHRDMDDWRFCKLFIYLTDVTEKSGPHVYVQNTSQSSKFRKIRRYSDIEIEKEFGKENVLKFTGEKGSAFIVDTYGFHKGLLPESEDRLLLQIQYSLYPIGIENYEPIETANKSDYNSYINRLLIK